MFSVHNACPFGAVASVHAWERLGAALCYLGRKLLGLPLLRYVDDYYGPDRCVLWSTPCVISRQHVWCRLETLSHGVTCFVRLVRILLGPTAVADNKVAWGEQLSILGVDVSLSSRGFRFQPCDSKAAKWCHAIDAFLNTGRMDPGEASKMSGRLAWACSHSFNKLGRAMLRPLYDQSSRRDGAMDTELRRALVWWKTVLGMRIAVLRSWHGVRAAPVHLFCDA